MREPGTYRSRVNAAENAVVDACCRKHAAEVEAERAMADVVSYDLGDALAGSGWLDEEPEDTVPKPEPAPRRSAFDILEYLITEEAPAAVIRRAATRLRVWESGMMAGTRSTLCPESEHELATTDAEGNRKYTRVPHGTTYRVTKYDTGYGVELVKVTTLVTRLGNIIAEAETA